MICVCKINVRRVLLYRCTFVSSYLRFLRPPPSFHWNWNHVWMEHFVAGFSFIILNNSTHAMGRSHSSTMNADDALSCSSMPGGSARTTWAFGIPSCWACVCSVSLFQRHEGRFEVLFSVVGVLKSLIICHLIDYRRIEKYGIPDLPSFQNSSRLSSIKR